MKKTIIASLVLLASALPSLHLFGVKDFIKLAGFIKVAPIAKLTVRSFVDRSYQTSLEASYSKSFFLRGLLFKTRCQVYEWVNFGSFHEARDRRIGQFADGTLFSQTYLETYCNPWSRVSKDNVADSLSAISALKEHLASRGIDLVFVMAVDKIQMTDKPLPWLTKVLFKKRRTEFQTEFAQLLSEYGISSFDTHFFLKEKAHLYAEPMFPFAGTHWNALGSGLVTEELLLRLNAQSNQTYRINRFVGVTETPEARYADDDLGKLLNLFSNPYLRRNTRYLPKFEDSHFKPNRGSVLLFGDSFSWEIFFSLIRSREFPRKKILICDKRIPSQAEIESVMPDLKLVAFVYVTPNMLNLDQRFGPKIKKLCEMLQQPQFVNDQAKGESSVSQ
jgi:hypothetical protein